MSITRFVVYFINFIFAVIELIIATRIIFKLLGANPATPFVILVYQISASLIYPFHGIFPSPVLNGGFVLEISAIVALLVYAVIAYLISQVLWFASARYTRRGTNTEETEVIREEE